MRGYYPGEREYRERPRPRIHRPRIPDPRGHDLHLPKPALRRSREAAGARAAARARPQAVPGTSRRPRLDWALGIALGIVVGLAVIVAFLVFGSEGTIDAPSLHGVEHGRPAQTSHP